MRLKVRSIPDVVRSELCCGCGACAAASDGAIEMVDSIEHGRRPRARDGSVPPALGSSLLRLCPGVAIEHDKATTTAGIASVRAGFGPVLEVWEGHARDEAVRYVASSGGAITALATYGLEHAGWHGVLHIAARADAPHLNETVLSRSAGELRVRAGSRYAPASPCDGLDRIERAPAPCGFIGKPCDVAGARRAAARRPGLENRLALTIGLFCAGTPTTRGTLEMLRRMRIDDPAALTGLRYRGHGWPGNATATTSRGATTSTRRLPYDEVWGEILTRHKQWRCRICPDHTGEFADIAVGDPWHRPPSGDESGRSLIVVRTQRGRAFLRGALDAGVLVAWPVGPGVLEASQPDLLRARGLAWGRCVAMRLLGRPVPRFKGLPMFRFWWSRTSAAAKVRSIFGTMRRLGVRRPRIDLDSIEQDDTMREETAPGSVARLTPEREAHVRTAA